MEMYLMLKERLSLIELNKLKIGDCSVIVNKIDKIHFE